MALTFPKLKLPALPKLPHLGGKPEGILGLEDRKVEETKPSILDTLRIGGLPQLEKIEPMGVTPRMVIKEIPKATEKVGTAIGKFILESFAPVVIPTYKKVKAGKSLWVAYKESYKELDEKEKEVANTIAKEYEEAEKKGASTWELSKIASNSPIAQKIALSTFYFIGGMKFTSLEKMTSDLARNVLKVGKKATEKEIQSAFRTAIHKPEIRNILTGLSKKSGAKEMNILTKARDVLLKRIPKKIPTKPLALPGIKEVKLKIKPKSITQLRKEIKLEIKTKAEQQKFLQNLKKDITIAIEKTNYQRTKDLLKLQTEIETEILKKRIGKASINQIREVSFIAKRKALITPEGKSTPQYRKLARAITDESRIKNMTEIEADAFINALKRIAEPKYIKGKLVPPSIPITTKIVPKGFFEGMKFKEPTIVRIVTPQTYYSQVLGVKPLVEPLELAKQRFDLRYRDMSNGVDKMIKLVDKVSRTSFQEKARAKTRNIPTKAVSEMRDLLDKYEEAPANLSPEKKEIFNWFRSLNREMLKAQNEIREKIELNPIRYRKAYVRHTADSMAQEMLQGKYPFPEGLKYWSGRVVGKKIFNPMEFQRQLAEDLEGLWTKDLAHATKSMIWTGLKEIHLDQPLQSFNEQLGAISKDISVYKNLTPEEQEIYNQIRTIPASTKKWLIDYVNQVIKGQETWLDEQVNNVVTKTGLSGLLNKVLAPFGRTIGRKPITDIFQIGGRVMIHGVMGPIRPKQLIRNKFQLTQNLALYTIKANLKGFYPVSANKTLKELMDKSLFLKTYTGIEELPQNLQGKLEKLNLAAFQWTASSNVAQAMKVAYWDTLDLITNPKYKNLGWADPERTYKEAKGFLYPSEKEKLLKEMEFGAGVTQYHYIAMGMPEVFRHKALVPLTRLQSWWMNYFFKFNREAITRAITGKTGYGMKLPWSRRLGWFRYLILGGLILNTLGYEKSYLWGVAPTGTPPTAQFMAGLYTYLTTLPNLDEDWAKKKNTQAKKQMFYAMKTFVPGYLAWKDFMGLWSGEKSWDEYFFYKKGKEKKEGGGGLPKLPELPPFPKSPSLPKLPSFTEVKQSTEKIPRVKENKEVKESSVLDTILLYAKSIGTDPHTAFNRIFTGQRIRRIDNNTIIVERMPFSESEAVKEKQGAGGDMVLDHTIPLQLGGSNNKGNLKIVSVDEWESYTPIENYLGGLLRNDRITKRKSQQLIRDFKEGKISSEEIYRIK